MRKNKSSQSDAAQPEARQEKRERKMNRKKQGVKSQRDPQRRSSSLGAGIAVVAGRAAGALSRRLHLGGGTTIAGVVAQQIYPDIVEHLAAQLEHGSIVVTGTNGKTTTSSFIAAILGDAGLRVWRNREGSNLMRGVASSLVIRAQPNGKLRRSGRAISIFELDEAALPQVVPLVQPRIAVFTNLFRDQLDRYGEVDSVLGYWKRAVSAMPEGSTLVLNADDPATASLGQAFPGRVLYFGIEDPSLDLLSRQDGNTRHQVMDTRSCPQCGEDFTYAILFYSHMGHYSCPKCGLKRPEPDVRATAVQSDSFDRLRITVAANSEEQTLTIPLPGLYNAYNALAAITVSRAIDTGWEPIITGIEQSKPVFGRGERIQVEGRTMRLLLAKNPTGFNEVLRTLFGDGNPRHVLFVLNDNIADGRDISWIWDVDFERAVGQTKTLTIAGTRALDLALRLKYAGVVEEEMDIVSPAPLRANKKAARATALRRKSRQKQSQLEISAQETTPTRLYGLKSALDRALSRTPAGETLFVVPTYTALLEVHRELEQRGLTPRYWEGRDA